MLSCQGTGDDWGKGGKQSLPAADIHAGEQAPSSCCEPQSHCLLCPPHSAHSAQAGCAHPAPGLHSTHSQADSSVLELLIQAVRELSQVLFFKYSISRPHSPGFHSNVLVNRKIWIQALRVEKVDKPWMNDLYGKCAFWRAVIQEELPEQPSAVQVMSGSLFQVFTKTSWINADTENEKPISGKPDGGHGLLTFVLSTTVIFCSTQTAVTVLNTFQMQMFCILKQQIGTIRCKT